MTHQTIDWSTPESGALLRRIHLRQALRERPFTLMALAVVLGLAAVSGAGAWPLFAGVTVVLVMLVAGTLARVRRVQQAAQASGPTSYTAVPGEVQVSNSFGDFRIPLTQISRLYRDPEGLILVYAGNSMMTLPPGPVREALERAWSTRQGGTP